MSRGAGSLLMVCACIHALSFTAPPPKHTHPYTTTLPLPTPPGTNTPVDLTWVDLLLTTHLLPDQTGPVLLWLETAKSGEGVSDNTRH